GDPCFVCRYVNALSPTLDDGVPLDVVGREDGEDFVEYAGE
ncbi:hypothetical protein A2U01_0085756, partial [Trifolium medium]|nr:hypothetical protein [Trifolium medium]